MTLSIFPGVLAEDLSSQELGSWYPVALITVFNLADFAGKYAPALPRLRVPLNGRALVILSISRVIFIPAFHFSAIYGAGPIFSGLLALLLGVSNGYLTAEAMMLAPTRVQGNNTAASYLCGNIMVLSLILGLCIGAACGFLWLL